MKHKLKPKTRVFLIAFGISTAAYGVLLILLINFWSPVSTPENPVGKTQDMTLSQAQSILGGGESSIVVYFTTGEDTPHVFYLLTYQPDQKMICLRSISPSLPTAYRTEKLPLAALHRIYGVRSVQSGIENALNIPISAAVFADREGLLTVLNTLGSVNFRLEEDTEYTEIYSEKTFVLSAGEQTLSPTAVAGLLRTYELANDEAHMTELMATIIAQKGSAFTAGERMVNVVYGTCETNLSAADVTLALPVFQNLFSTGKDVVLIGDPIQ